MFSRPIHPVAGISAPLRFMAEEYSVVCPYHNLFIHSAFDGHLDCFHILAMVNNATTSIHVKVFKYLFSIVGGIYLGVKLLGYMITLHLCAISF